MRSLALLAVILLLGFASSAPLLHADIDVADIIPDQYIIVLKEKLTSLEKSSHMLELKDRILNDPDASVAEEVRGDFDFGGEGKHKGFFATLSKAKLAEQLAHPNVKYVELNKVVRLLDQREQAGPSIGEKQPDALDKSWGLPRVSQHYLPLERDYHYNWTTISEVTAYIVDTGINTQHKDFGGRASTVFNAITNEPSEDENGHGTHCAGTVGGQDYGIHKGVTLHAVKVLGRTGSGTWEGVIAGINFVAAHHRGGSKRSVANMSLGGGKNTAVDQAVDAAVDAGVAMVVAAGNNNWDACQYSPASASKAISVGATNSRDARASFSNYGPCCHIYAPGEQITSDWIGSDKAINTISGTSMAAPHVCGVVALHRDWNPSATPLQLRSWLQEVSTVGIISGLPTTPLSVNFLLYSPHSREEVTANV